MTSGGTGGLLLFGAAARAPKARRRCKQSGHGRSVAGGSIALDAAARSGPGGLPSGSGVPAEQRRLGRHRGRASSGGAVWCRRGQPLGACRGPSRDRAQAPPVHRSAASAPKRRSRPNRRHGRKVPSRLPTRRQDLRPARTYAPPPSAQGTAWQSRTVAADATGSRRRDRACVRWGSGARALQCFMETLKRSRSLTYRIFFTRTGGHFARKCSRAGASDASRAPRGPPPQMPSPAWMPHSVLARPRQRPARGSSPGFTRLVQGMQPMDRKPCCSSGWCGRPWLSI